MALARPLPPLWQSLLPSLNGPVRPLLSLPLLQRLSLPFASLAIPALSLPSIPSLSEIWDGVLKAVPKKKTSYRKKRQRFMAGKSLEDITSLNRCSGCGRMKRSHMLCPYCVHTIRTKFLNIFPSKTPGKKELRQLKREEIAKRRDKRASAPHPDDKTDMLGPWKWPRAGGRKDGP
ncbi:hypothetical protein EJ04DRAFT_513895 [Polyplosphaeria fusca]|uniref:Large ribosomal subunit protein bL32m n=1 Tax=Polyplosphaeria fusca TaxID=682080 RepID=A0A9P4QVR1_9PLEO|nr:hypothetical protein EJ04DRAFT_513895 [Polyplosphaeria fusca]